MLALISTVASGQSPTDSAKDTTAQRKEAWTASLRKLFAESKGYVVADVDVSRIVPAMTTVVRPDEYSQASLVGALIHREPRQLPSGWIFVRGTYTGDNPLNDFALASRWLATITDDELRHLCGDGMSLSEMSPEGRMLFARMCGNRGLQDKMAKGEFVRAAVRMSVAARAIDSKGKPQTLIVDSLFAGSPSETAVTERQEAAYKAQRGPTGGRGVVPYPPDEDSVVSGELDLHEGRLLTVEEVVALARAAFQRGFIADSRIGKSTVYWQGRFTKDRFVEALRTVTNTLEAKESPTTMEAANAAIERVLRDKIAKLIDLSDAPNGLSYEDALKGRQVGVKDLAVSMRGLSNALSSYGLSPNSRFTLVPALAISLSASGSYRDPQQPNESPVGNVWSMVFLP